MKRKLKSYKKFKLPYKPLVPLLIAAGAVIYVVMAYGSVGSWEATATAGAPDARRGHTAVWTGNTGNPATANRMIVWGGAGGPGQAPYFNTGGVYNPATGEWVATTTNGAPSPRHSHTAVWTGNTGNASTANRMIVYGGRTANGLTATGGIYNPATNSWQPTSTVQGTCSFFGVPNPRCEATSGPYAKAGHTAVWTGNTRNPRAANKMIVWGGEDLIASGDYTGNTSVNSQITIYTPESDSWITSTPRYSPSPRSKHTAVWTGNTGNAATADRMIIWGGTNSTASGVGLYNNTGAVLDFSLIYNSGPITDPGFKLEVWTPLPLLNAPTPRVDHTAVWVEDRMIVWGGAANCPIATNPSCYLGDGAALKENFTRWDPLPIDTAVDSRSRHTAVVYRDSMIIWGGYNANSIKFDPTGGMFETSTAKWFGTSKNNAPTRRERHTAIWTGETGNPATDNRMIIWGGGQYGDSATNTGGMFRPY